MMIFIFSFENNYESFVLVFMSKEYIAWTETIGPTKNLLDIKKA
jgi:hypothetical protein